MPESQAPAYKPIPVEVGRQISQHFAKQIVVIVAVDHVHDKTQFTTYGQFPEDKIIAAHLGDAFCKSTGSLIEECEKFEDFRTVDAAERAAENEVFRRLVVACDHTLGSLLAVRNGITDEALQALRDQIKIALGKA